MQRDALPPAQRKKTTRESCGGYAKRRARKARRIVLAACASGTNSLQTPKLPDWAIVDTTVPPDDKFPGKIVDAGFFDEQWRFTTERPK